MAEKQEKSGPITLADMITSVRAELKRAEIEGHGLELVVTAEHSATGGGGIKVWVIEAGADATAKKGQSHKVKVKLKPTSGAPNPDGSPDRLIVTSDGVAPASQDDAMPLGND